MNSKFHRVHTLISIWHIRFYGDEVIILCGGNVKAVS